MNRISWDWNPGVAVGPFQFGSDAGDVIARFGLRKLEPDCFSAFWDSYEIPDCESSISVEDNKIASVECYDHLYHKSKDILSLDISHARSILGPETKSEVHPYVEGILVVYYDDLGLTLFVDGERIESATCNERQTEQI